MSNSSRHRLVADDPGRRGAALLIVLAVLVIAVTATGILARSAGTVRMHSRLDHAALTSTDLMGSLDRVILHWLQSSSNRIVLPPDAAEPVVEVLHEVIQTGDGGIEVQVTGWDQCGLAPLEMLRSGSPIRGALPPAVIDSIDRVRIPRDVRDMIVGLDLFIEIDEPRRKRIPVFPPSPDTEPTPFTGGDLPSVSAEPPVGASASAKSMRGAGDVPALGARVATHNAVPHRININTAPREILQAVMRDLGRGGVDQIMEAREKGVPVTMAAIPPMDEDRSAAASLVDQSSAWAFRIDLRVGPLRRSWWAVYSNRAPARSSETVWRCVQRLAITE